LKEWCTQIKQNNKTKSVGETAQTMLATSDLWCSPQEEKGGLMSDKNNTDSSVKELKGKAYSISKLGSQVDTFAAMTRAIGEVVGGEFGHEMRMLVLYGKEASNVLMPAQQTG
jgi:hypothetical protein